MKGRLVLALLAVAWLTPYTVEIVEAQVPSGQLQARAHHHRLIHRDPHNRHLLQDDDEDFEEDFIEEEVLVPAPANSSAPPEVIKVKVKKSNRTKKAPFQNNVVEFAPQANITNGDDVDDEGKCAVEVEKYCKSLDQGEGKLAECLSDAIAHSENPGIGAGNDEVPQVSDACREEVYQFMISRASNINRNIPLAKACKVDADKFCNVTWFFGYKEGQVITCLRDYKNQLTPKCRKEVGKVQQAAALDMRADPTLWEACKTDAASLCKDVKHGGGRVQACLRDQRMKLSWVCDEQLLRQEIENADDIRLSVRMYARCMPDKRKFCRDVEPGHARTKECLEQHRLELSLPCRAEIESMIARRVQDFRLDSNLRSACEAEITNMCAYFGDLDDIDTYDSSVINCLQDYSAEIKSLECKRQVKKYIVLAASDIRFDVSLAEACSEDRNKYCANVPPGSARVIRCLTRQREKLSPVCRATLFDEEVRFSENIDFQYPMKEACQAELNKFCKDVPHGNARAIRCLQDNKDNKDFGKTCREEVEAYETEISKDYRLNFRLNKNCAKDVSTLCPNVCSQNDGNVCGGKVLRCLTEKVDQIKSEDCKQEVFYYQKMEVENYQNDIILAEACRHDVEEFCANVDPGGGRVHKCLRDNRKKLSEPCRKEELLLEEQEAGNVELSQSLLRSCKAERQLFCRDVKPGSARVFRCLAENMNDPDFGAICKFQVMYKLQRRQANWKLDPSLRKACRKDVYEFCSLEVARDSEEGLVYKCLIRNVAALASGCSRELSRAVHMALYAWQPGAILTSDCDEDINKYCLAARPNMISRPGAIGSCLASILERQDQSQSKPTRRRRLADDQPQAENPQPDAQPQPEEKKDEQPKPEEKKDEQPKQEAAPQETQQQMVAEPIMARVDGTQDVGDAGAMSPANFKALVGARLSDMCYMLADIAEPPNMKQAFDSSLSFALLKSQLDKLDKATGLSLVTRNSRGKAQDVSLTGWVAMAGMAAFIVLILSGTFFLYKRIRGIPDRDYTLVVKQTHK